MRAKINKKDSGKYRQISKAITIDKAKGNLNIYPKILISIYFWPKKFKSNLLNILILIMISLYQKLIQSIFQNG